MAGWMTVKRIFSMEISESDTWWVQMKVRNLRVRTSASYRCMADDRAEGFL